jgi:hypothetical protein
MRTHRIFRANLAVAMMLLALCAISCTQDKPAAPTAQPGAVSATRAPASVANAAGTWTWSLDAAGNPITHTAVLKQDGEKLSGTFTDSFDNTTVAIKEGKIHDGQVTLTIVRPFMDNGNMTFNCVGKLEGNTIKGKIDWSFGDQPTSSEWNAKRGS